jgi:hypothetical protein
LEEFRGEPPQALYYVLQMEFVRIITALVEEPAFGEKLEQLGCIQYQQSDVGSQRTRKSTVQMSMADVQGYLRVTSGARMRDG